MHRIKNKDVPVTSQTGVAIEQIGLGSREQRLARGDRRRIALCYSRDGFEIRIRPVEAALRSV